MQLHRGRRTRFSTRVRLWALTLVSACAAIACLSLYGRTPWAQLTLTKHTQASSEGSTGGSVISSSHGAPASPPEDPIHLPLWWFAPFLDTSSFGLEASNFMLPLVQRGIVPPQNARIGLLQMSCADSAWDTVAPETRQALVSMLHTKPAPRPAVVVCHNMPLFMGRPSPRWASCDPCPPRQAFAFAVARVMVEVTGLPQSWVTAINSLDEVWVPSQFSRTVLTNAGIPPSKIQLLPPAVNTSLFRPGSHPPLDLDDPHSLPLGYTWVFPERQRLQPPAGWTRHWPRRQSPFKFVSVGKWEPRKGWDVLLPAYLKAFTNRDPVVLYVVTKPFSSSQSIHEEVTKLLPVDRPHHTLPKLVVTSRLSTATYLQLLASADAFVLATRGEGWGLPLVEAMSMALPVIATNWSGVSDYLTDQVGYPVQHRVVDVPASVHEEWFRGYQWSEPEPAHLQQLLRHVASHPGEARQRGLHARQLMETQYSLEAVSSLLAGHLRRVEALVNTTLPQQHMHPRL